MANDTIWMIEITENYFADNQEYGFSCISPTPNASVNWGDGTTEDVQFTNKHAYTSPGIYILTVSNFNTDFYNICFGFINGQFVKSIIPPSAAICQSPFYIFFILSRVPAVYHGLSCFCATTLEPFIYISGFS
jgi:hypothetical protein